MDPNVIMNRIMRLARLDTTVFDEVRDDQRETLPAVLIVVAGCILAFVGVWLWILFEKPDGLDIDYGNLFVKVFLMGTVFTVAMWGVWVAVAYVVLVQFYKEQADLQSLVRTMGYAALPFSLSLVALIPGLHFGVGITALVVWFVLSIYAVQATTAAASERVVMANIVGFLVFAVVLGLLARSTGMATGVFMDTEAGKTFEEGEFFKVPSVNIPGNFGR